MKTMNDGSGGKNTDPGAIRMKFFVGTDSPNHAQHFERAFISVNRLHARKSGFPANDWIMDSGAFTQVSSHGGFIMSVEKYSDHINRFAGNGRLLAAVSQDWMCEPFILQRTGLTVAEHHKRTVDHYLQIRDRTNVYVMPVLQGYAVQDYLTHLDLYGSILTSGAWVGVGSICKRNTNIAAIEDILTAIKQRRPDLHLHGFGLKTSALLSPCVVNLLHSADSMAWSFAARKQGRDAHDWREAKAFADRINRGCVTARTAPRQITMSLCT